jgi:hypothetical protein
MKTISYGHYTLSICAVAAMLAACGGSGQLPIHTAQTSLGGSDVATNSPGTELLTGKAELIKACHTIRGQHGKNQGWSTNFRAHGNATGPYPGTFTASGEWTASQNSVHQAQWVFSEYFAITSASSTISGTINGIGVNGSLPFSCTVVKNLAVPYESGSVSGTAVIKVIQKRDFREKFDKL